MEEYSPKQVITMCSIINIKCELIINNPHKRDETFFKRREKTSLKVSTFYSFNLDNSNNFSHQHINIGDHEEKLKVEVVIPKGDFRMSLEDDQDDTNEEVGLNWWQIWNHLITSIKAKLPCIHWKNVEGLRNRSCLLDLIFLA
jgi:hypothetical protein